MQCRMVGIEITQRIQHPALSARSHPGRTLEVQDGISRRTQHRPLICRRHVTAGPVLGPGDRSSDGIEHHGEAR